MMTSFEGNSVKTKDLKNKIVLYISDDRRSDYNKFMIKCDQAQNITIPDLGKRVFIVKSLLTNRRWIPKWEISQL